MFELWFGIVYDVCVREQQQHMLFSLKRASLAKAKVVET